MAFKRIGSDRLNMGIAGATNSPTGTLFTGDITKGSVVAVEFDNSTTGTATVSARRTGAIPLNQPFNTDSWKWSIDGTKLTVVYQGNQTGTSLFWVF